MFQAINAHLQEDILYTYRVTVPYAACIQCILLKMSTYGSKHVEE